MLCSSSIRWLAACRPCARSWRRPTGCAGAGGGGARRPREAVRVVVSGRCRSVDLGVIEWEKHPAGEPEKRYFLLMAGIGLDAHVVGRVPQGWKRHLGAAAYVRAGSRLRLKGIVCHQSVQAQLGHGREVETGWLLAGN